jgi:hypothetical protein
MIRYWCDDYDTWAAVSLKDVAKEQRAQNIICDYDFDQNDWHEVSPFTRMWLCEVGEALRERKRGTFWFLVAKIKWHRPLWWCFLFHRPPSETGRAWFMCSTEV